MLCDLEVLWDYNYSQFERTMCVTPPLLLLVPIGSHSIRLLRNPASALHSSFANTQRTSKLTKEHSR